MEEMRKDLSENPPLAGSFTPRKGQMCVARFSDGLWYVPSPYECSGALKFVGYILGPSSIKEKAKIILMHVT